MDNEAAIAIVILVTTAVAARSLLVSSQHRHLECLAPSRMWQTTA
jgi:hypothetical protein